MVSVKGGLRAVLVMAAGVGLAVLSGCRPWGADANSPQGRELESILKNQRVIQVDAPEGMPIAFQPVQVEKRVEQNGSIRYRAVTVVKVPGDGADAQRRLRELASAKSKDAVTANQQVRSARVRVEYHDENGGLLNTETVTVPLTGSSAVVVLEELGAQGSPSHITTRLEALEVVIPEQSRTVPMS
jgi:hypothetical protein